MTIISNAGLEIELKLSVVSPGKVILGCVRVITVITQEAYLARVIPSAGPHEIYSNLSFLRSVTYSVE